MWMSQKYLECPGLNVLALEGKETQQIKYLIWFQELVFLSESIFANLALSVYSRHPQLKICSLKIMMMMMRRRRRMLMAVMTMTSALIYQIIEGEARNKYRRGFNFT